MVDIIIPTYNRVSTISDSIDSCIQQQSVKIRILIIDNFSTDGTKELVFRKYADEIESGILEYHYFDSLVEIHENWNRGLELIRAKYFKFVFSDDYLDKNFCCSAIKSIEKSGSKMYVSALNYFNEDGVYKTRKYGNLLRFNSRWMFLASLLSRNNISAPTNCMMVNENLNTIRFTANRVATDYIFFYDYLKSLNWPSIYYDRKPLAFFRTSGRTLTNELKLSVRWIQLNHDAKRNIVSREFPRFTLFVHVASSIYSMLVLIAIEKFNSDKFQEAQTYVYQNSLYNKYLYLLLKRLFNWKNL